MTTNVERVMQVTTDSVQAWKYWNGFNNSIGSMSKNGFSWSELISAVWHGVGFLIHGKNAFDGICDLLARVWDAIKTALTTKAPERQPATAINQVELFQQQHTQNRELVRIPRHIGGWNFGN